jgi:hypothetical protein
MDLNQVLETGKFQQVLCEICEWEANWTKPQVSFCEIWEWDETGSSSSVFL